MNFPEVIATAFRRELSTGATRPCVFGCEDTEEESAGEYVVKFRADVRGAETGLLFECVAASLANRLGLVTPEVAIVVFEADLVEATDGTSIGTRVQSSFGPNFGSRYLSPGYVTWPVDEPVSMAMRRPAAEIFAFDALIDNADRRREKPNLLWRGNELVVIDHELAFAFLRIVGTAPKPFDPGGLDHMRQHPLYAGLKGKDIDLDRFAGELEAITDAEIDDICDKPSRWFGDEHLAEVKAHLKECRNRAALLMVSVRSVLQ